MKNRLYLGILLFSIAIFISCEKENSDININPIVSSLNPDKNLQDEGTTMTGGGGGDGSSSILFPSGAKFSLNVSIKNGSYKVTYDTSKKNYPIVTEIKFDTTYTQKYDLNNHVISDVTFDSSNLLKSFKVTITYNQYIKTQSPLKPTSYEWVFANTCESTIWFYK